eukprot:5193985-Alexandrium_andersonii.AAC.1
MSALRRHLVNDQSASRFTHKRAKLRMANRTAPYAQGARPRWVQAHLCCCESNCRGHKDDVYSC